MIGMEARSLLAMWGTGRAVQKKAAQLRWGSRAAQDWGYEHEYATTSLMQPDA
jgi:hypothetical protein